MFEEIIAAIRAANLSTMTCLNYGTSDDAVDAIEKAGGERFLLVYDDGFAIEGAKLTVHGGIQIRAQRWSRQATAEEMQAHRGDSPARLKPIGAP